MAIPPALRKAPISASDLIVSTIALLLTVFVGAGAAMGARFLLALLDFCLPGTCNADGAVIAVAVALAAAQLVGIIGLVVTIVRLVRRGKAWPFAVATLALCGVICALGGVAYFAAAGA